MLDSEPWGPLVKSGSASDSGQVGGVAQAVGNRARAYHVRSGPTPAPAHAARTGKPIEEIVGAVSAWAQRCAASICRVGSARFSRYESMHELRVHSPPK